MQKFDYLLRLVLIAHIASGFQLNLSIGNGAMQSRTCARRIFGRNHAPRLGPLFAGNQVSTDDNVASLKAQLAGLHERIDRYH